MTRADVVRNLNVCLRCLGVDCPAGAGLMPYEDAMFFFQDNILYMNGQSTEIMAGQIECIRYRPDPVSPLGEIVIYYRTDEDELRLLIRFDEKGSICGLQLQVETHTRRVMEGYSDVMCYLRTGAERNAFSCSPGES